MGERLKPAVLKTVVLERVPGVRIPLPPPVDLRSLTVLFWLSCLAIGMAGRAFAQADPGQVAFALEREGKLAEAAEAWSALARQYPTKAEPLAHLGLIESKQERYGEAIKHYKQAITLDPHMPGLRLNLGLALFKAGEYPQTVATLEPLRKTHPEDQQLTVLIGMSQYGLQPLLRMLPACCKQASNAIRKTLRCS